MMIRSYKEIKEENEEYKEIIQRQNEILIKLTQHLINLKKEEKKNENNSNK